MRWRTKIILPLFASFPVLLVYKLTNGSTDLIVPEFIQSILGFPSKIKLGFLQYIYLSLLSVFCSNSINIYAGINGLETGQTALISLALMGFNSMYVSSKFSTPFQTGHAFSYVILLPFFGANFALYSFNKFVTMNLQRL